MQFDERDEGDYRIYAGAMPSDGEGYIAAVVVSRVRGAADTPREAFRDNSLAHGHLWTSPSAALSYAVGKGREVINTECYRLAC